MLRPLRDYVAFDFETTGLERDTDEIVEIGAVRVKDGALEERFTRLLKASKPLSPLVEALTGLTPDILAQAVEPGPALQEFLDFAGGLPLVAHNSDFDSAFLQEALRKLSMPPAANPVFDSLLLARMAWPTMDSHRLEDLAKALAMPPDRAHRALPDAERSAMLWNLAQEKLAGYRPATLDALARVLEPGPAHWRGLFDPASEAAASEAAGADAGSAAPASQAHAAGAADPAPAKGDRGAEGLFAADGPVAGAFASVGRAYQARAGQGRLASLADRALAEGCFLAVEADPGTGRTLATLVAAARFAMAGRRTVFFAVSGKSQLERIVTSQFPILSAMLGRGLRLAVLKPPSSYLSPRKYADILRDPATRLADAERLALLPLVTWKEGTASGDAGENMGFNHERQKVLWSKLGADSYAAEPGAFAGHAREAREQASRAHLVLVTHDLVLDDIGVDFALLPPYETIIVDDAHRLVESGQERLGREVGFFRLRHALQLLAHSKNEDRGLLAALDRAGAAAGSDGSAEGGLPAAFKEDLARLREKAFEPEKQLQKLFNKIGKHAQKRRKDGESRIRYADKLVTEFNSSPEAVVASLAEVEGLLASLDSALGASSLPENRSLALDLRKAAGLLRGIRSDLEHLGSPGQGEVFWIEEFANPHRALIRCAPKDAGSILAEKFHSQMGAAVYVSSSLALGDQLGFFCRQIGLEPAHLERVRTAAVRGQGASHQVAPLLLARFSPVLSGAQAMAGMADILGRTLRRLGSPAFLLFTHVGLLKQCRARLGEELGKDGRMVAAQHVDGNREGLLHLFRHRKDACLLGTDMFVEGLGAGDTLPEVVAVTKLPFPVPSDPLVAAALERVNEAGENPLYDFLLPSAILRLKQELGRLPRSADGKGRVALWILDPRLCTEKYARAFLRGLGREAVVCGNEEELLASTAEAWKGTLVTKPAREAGGPGQAPSQVSNQASQGPKGNRGRRPPRGAGSQAPAPQAAVVSPIPESQAAYPDAVADTPADGEPESEERAESAAPEGPLSQETALPPAGAP